MHFSLYFRLENRIEKYNYMRLVVPFPLSVPLPE